MIESKMEGEHIIEVDDLVISMARKLESESLVIRDKNAEFPLLHKMRRMTCDVDSNVYEPSVVSIGPYHHKSEATSKMAQTKWESLHYILGLNPNKKMRDYLEAMAGLEGQIRCCYANRIKADSDQLIKMMLLDGCFILHTLYGTDGATQPIPKLQMFDMDERNLGLELDVHKPDNSSEVDASQQVSFSNVDHENIVDDTYASRQWYFDFSARDLLILENQIPFFAVVKIYEVVSDGNGPVTVLLENVARFMEDLLHSYLKATLKFDRPTELHHLLHLCHTYFKPKQAHAKSNPDLSISDNDEADIIIAGRQLAGWHQVSEYHKTGLEFKKREFCTENPHSLLDVGFCKGVIEFPCLTVDPFTYCLFRNLLAFEETCPEIGNCITTYVVFLSQVVSTQEDVALLIKWGIIAHHLDSDAEVCNIFKMLANSVNFDVESDHYLKHVYHEMEVHYQMQRSRWREWVGSISSKLPGWSRESKTNQSGRRSLPDECV